MNFISEGIKDAYLGGIEMLLRCGGESSPRGKKIKEVLNVSFEIKNPRKRLVWFEAREKNFNLCHAIVEFFMLFENKNDVEYFAKFNENVRQFSDNGETFHGSYGKRIGNIGIIEVIGTLRKDKDSRQAVLSIYDSCLDLNVETKDVPCTETLQFLIRDNKLNMIVNMRSNDIVWGFPYDVFMFTSLQEVIANTLNVELGTYYHNVGSFHVYEEFFNTIYEMKENKVEEFECDALDGTGYEEIKGLANSYVDYVDSKKELVATGNLYLNVIRKEILYRNYLESMKKLNNVNLIDVDWAGQFTKRWYR